jgi:hypothetical protein
LFRGCVNYASHTACEVDLLTDWRRWYCLAHVQQGAAGQEDGSKNPSREDDPMRKDALQWALAGLPVLLWVIVPPRLAAG